MNTKLFTLAMLVLATAAKVSAVPPPAFVSLYAFGGTSAIPGGELAVGPGGNLFGTTYGGGAADGTGSIFELMRVGDGAFTCTTLYRFDTSGSPAGDGQYPFAGMTISPDGSTLFGTTQKGGTGDGTVFDFNPSAAQPLPHKPHHNGDGYNQLHDFDSATEGGQPQGRPLYVGDYALEVAGLFLFGTVYADGPSGDYGEIYSLNFSSANTASNHPVIIFYGANGAHPKGKLWAPPGHGVTPQHVLQVNAAPISPGWANAGGTVTDDGTNSSVNVLPAAGKTFFRLLSTNGP